MTLTAAPVYRIPVIKKDQPDDNFKFRPLPAPAGKYPYRLALKDVCVATSPEQVVFHMAGDTGSVRNADFQQLVAGVMARQYQTISDKKPPQFLYHLGDVVYNYGEAAQYYNQFFRPYKDYPGPIMAIAGNHDSDVNPDSAVPYQSLDAFAAVFCDVVSRPVIFSGDAARKSMIQPHIYWTLQTPLATIIGLHSNVPKFGIITDEQRNWFMAELKAAHLERPGKALIVCLHHAPYSADINHGSSLPMIEFLENAFRETGIRPDVVFSGHVHNYQRFGKVYADGVTVPYIVAGAGGYDELHAIALIQDERFTSNSPLFKGVSLDHYCDAKHGFLKIAIEKTGNKLTLTGEYYTLPQEEATDQELTATLEDRFILNI